MNTTDATIWTKLWYMALGFDGPDGGVATITPDPEDEGRVLLTYPDGSRLGLYWHGGEWQVQGEVNTCPGDVAARDSL